ncbi:MAG TPA: hypothetical protein VGO40_11950 [Longimicrobium sp.]|jgi:hypothetical protein|nr:hypothetical protein [Longimicrobium sp.]
MQTQIAGPPPPHLQQQDQAAATTSSSRAVDRLGWFTAADARARVLRDVLQAFALLIAALWGLYTFVYKEVIVPRNRPAALVVTPTLEAIGRRGDMVLARATFQMRNTSDSKVYAPAIWYAVRGLKLEGVEQDDSTYLRRLSQDAQKPFPSARFSQFSVVEVLGTGKVSAEVETWFEPGAEQRVEQILLIPADRYDAAQLQVQALISKDVHEVKEIRWRTTAEGDLDPRLVFTAGSRYAAGGVPAAMSDTVPRYVSWLRANGGGVNFVTATLALWRTGPAATAAPDAPSKSDPVP